MVGAMEPVGSQPQQHSPAMRAVRAALVGMTAAAVIGMGILWGRAKRGGELPAQEAAELELEVTANELATAYAYGKDEADRRYLGQWLIVSGTVDSVESGHDKVILRALDSLVGVSCRFEAGWSEQLARLQRWDDVVVRCRGKGMVLTTPLLESCALQSIQR